MKNAITYYRVSTERQGTSGLGLEAQEKAVHDYAAANNIHLLGEFMEVESGKRSNRPILLQAIKACEQHKAILLIAKLDRLARNVAFTSCLMESGIDFRAVDNPHAEKFFIHMMAAFAEHESDEISKRTISALQAAKRRGVVLGAHGIHVLSKLNRKLSKQFAARMKPLINMLQGNGIKTVRAITTELNRLHIPTFRNTGARWHVATVHKLIRQATAKK